MFSALAEGQGDLKNQINVFIALAPTVYMGNVTDDFFLIVSEATEILYESFKMGKIYELFGRKWQEISPIVCLFLDKIC